MKGLVRSCATLVFCLLATGACLSEPANAPPRTGEATEGAGETPTPRGPNEVGSERPMLQAEPSTQVVVDGTPLRVIQQPILTLDNGARTRKLRFSPDGSRVASLSVVRGTLRLWDVATGKELPQLKHPQVDSAEDFAFSADGRELATTHHRVGGAADVIIWSLSSFKPRLRMLWGYDHRPLRAERVQMAKLAGAGGPKVVDNPHLRWAHDRVAFAPDGGRLAVACKYGEQMIVDLRSGNTLAWTSQRFRATGCIEPIFSPDGKRLVWADNDNLHVWDLGREEPVAYPRDLGAWLVRYVHDGKTVATLGREGLALRDRASGKRVVVRTGPSRSPGAISPDGRLFASIHYRGSESALANVVVLWDVATARPTGVVAGDGYSTDFSPDGRVLATCNGTKIQLWDVSAIHDAAGKTEGFVGTFPEKQVEPDPPASPVCADVVWCVEKYSYCAAFSPDSSLLALADRDRVILWDVLARQECGRAENGARVVAFAPNGEYLAAGGIGRYNKTVFELLDVPGLQQRSEAIEQPKCYPTSMAFAPDGKSLAAACGDAIDIWDVKTGRIATALPAQSGPMAYSSDGGTLVCASNRTITLWNTSTWKERSTFRHEAGVRDVALSADGTVLAAVASRRAPSNLRGHGPPPPTHYFFTMWNTRTGKSLPLPAAMLKDPRGLRDDIPRFVAFSPRGKLLAVGKYHGLELWDVERSDRGPECRLRLTGGVVEGSGFNDLQFARDGKTLITVEDRRVIKFWDVATLLNTGEERGPPTDN